MSRDRLESFAFFGLFAGVSLLLFLVFSPFVQVLTLAAVFAVLLKKPHEKLASLLWGDRSVAAGIVVVLALVFCIAPLFFLGTQIFFEAQRVYFHAPGGGEQFLHTVQNGFVRTMQQFVPGFTFNADVYVGNALSLISTNLAGLVTETVYVVFNTFLMLLSFFFFLRDGPSVLESLRRMSPFGKKETDELLTRTQQTVSAVMKGTLLVAVVRWVLIGVVFYVFGIPNAILWSSVGGLVGAIPGLGTLLVFVPTVAFMFLQGNMLEALGLGMCGVGIIMFVDNMLTPYFFGKKIIVPQIFVLFSILGGMIFFGPIGFVMGPLVLSIFVAMLNIYSSSKVLPE